MQHLQVSDCMTTTSQITDRIRPRPHRIMQVSTRLNKPDSASWIHGNSHKWWNCCCRCLQHLPVSLQHLYTSRGLLHVLRQHKLKMVSYVCLGTCWFCEGINCFNIFVILDIIHICQIALWNIKFNEIFWF